MKSVLIIGLGGFGQHLCKKMVELKNEVMIVDEKAEKVEELMPIVTNGQIGDCTNVEVLRSIGVNNFDICFVCIGTNFQSSLEVTSPRRRRFVLVQIMCLTTLPLIPNILFLKFR